MASMKRIITFFAIIFLLVVTAAAFGLTVNYQYDDLYRLTRVESSDGSVITYSYDSMGNRITKITTTSFMKGDINNDGFVTLADAVLILQVISGMPPTTSVNNADVNSDGKIGSAEVIYILQIVSGFRDP